jgi:hypothetical protein
MALTGRQAVKAILKQYLLDWINTRPGASIIGKPTHQVSTMQYTEQAARTSLSIALGLFRFDSIPQLDGDVYSTDKELCV